MRPVSDGNDRVTPPTVALPEKFDVPADISEIFGNAINGADEVVAGSTQAEIQTVPAEADAEADNPPSTETTARAVVWMICRSQFLVDPSFIKPSRKAV